MKVAIYSLYVCHLYTIVHLISNYINQLQTFHVNSSIDQRNLEIVWSIVKNTQKIIYIKAL